MLYLQAFVLLYKFVRHSVIIIYQNPNRRLESMQITFHVGFPKTGTTFLQKEIFPKMKKLNYRDVHNTPDRDFKKCLEILIDPKKDYKFNPKKFEKRFSKFVSQKKPSLYSYEDLVGDVFLQDKMLAFRILDRIHSTYPEARIIVGLRDPQESIISLYSQYVREGGVKDFSGFITEVIDVEWYEHESYIRHAKKLFGDENVYVSEFKVLKKDAGAFVSGVADFLGAQPPEFERKRVNIAYGKRQVDVARMLNNLFRNELNPKGIIPWNEKWWFFPYPPRLLMNNKLSYWLNYERKIVSDEEKKQLAQLLAK